MSSDFCGLAIKAHLCIFSPPPPDYWFTSFFFQVGPGPRHEIAASAFSRNPLDRANTFSFPFLLLASRASLSVLSLSRYFLAFPFFLSLPVLLSCTPPNLSMDSISSWFPLIFFNSLLRYPTLFQLALLLLSPIQPYQLWLATSFLACSLLHIALSTFSSLYSFLVSKFPFLLFILYCSSYLSVLVLF